MKSKPINLEFEFHEWEIIREALINLAAQRMHIAPARVAKTIDAGLAAEENRVRYSNSKPKLLANIITEELIDSPQEL